MSSLFGVPLDAAYHVISALVSLLTPLFGGLAAAAAIIAFTMAVRLLLMPLSYRAMRGLDSQSRIAPQVILGERAFLRRLSAGREGPAPATGPTYAPN